MTFSEKIYVLCVLKSQACAPSLTPIACDENYNLCTQTDDRQIDVAFGFW